jgi:hypothetical protein
MKRFTACMIIFSAYCILALSIPIAFAGPEGGVIVVPQSDADIEIDGNLGEWKLELFTEEQKIVLTRKNGFINSGDIDDDDDFSAVVYALYDEDNLYLAAEVTDDATEDGFTGSNNWQNDCIEIWIDGAGDDGTMTDRGGNDPDNYQFNVDVNGFPYVYRNDNAAALLDEMESAASLKGTDYILEVRIPFSAIPELDLDKNRIMGFSVSFVDSDKGVWNHILWQGEVEHEPTTWGDLEFLLEKLSVKPAGKLSATWGFMKSDLLF